MKGIDVVQTQEVGRGFCVEDVNVAVVAGLAAGSVPVPPPFIVCVKGAFVGKS